MTQCPTPKYATVCKQQTAQQSTPPEGGSVSFRQIIPDISNKSMYANIWALMIW